MKKQKLIQMVSLAAALTFLAPSLNVHAEPIILEDSGLAVTGAEEVDDDQAVENADEGEKHGTLADPREAADYLLQNAQTGVITQVPTDERDTSLPEKFDLRDKGVVTPVKFQNPWGTCWGFAAIAASETSILSEMGKTYEETGLDLSEHHLTYFTRTFLQDGSSQDGEGVHMLDDSETFNTGGLMFTACSVFSSGIGPVDEALIPYRGKNSETESTMFINLCYSEEDDWSLPSDYEFVQAYDLQESNVLPAPAVYDFENPEDEDDMDDREEAYIGYDASATDIIKRELMAGRAVSICYCADQYMPAQLSGDADVQPYYLNTEDNKWTHYTFDGGVSNHAVTVVGWDDSIPASDFLDHSTDPDGDGLAHQPEGDGAWIVKNSWGSSTEEFPNSFPWGIEDEDGKSTGYFYISYYDRSLCLAETFDFDVTDNDNTAYMIDQYDYMQSNGTAGWADSNGLQMANVFTTESDSLLRAVSCQTNTENVSVTYQIYLLDEDAPTPDDGQLAASITEDYAHAGYHKAYLEEPLALNKGQRYSVVVTSCFTDGSTVYYEFSTSTADNEEYVKEYNRKIRYRNRGEDPETYEEDLLKYYSVGIVNEGESYVYMNSLGQWGDLGQIVPLLQQDEWYQDVDFDNFPVKAYLDYADEAQAEADIADIMSSDLEFAEPASAINVGYIVKCAAIGVAVIVLIVLVTLLCVWLAGRHRQFGKLKKKAAALEKENAELRQQMGTLQQSVRELTESKSTPGTSEESEVSEGQKEE